MSDDFLRNSSKANLRRFYQLVRPFLWTLILAAILMVIAAGIELFLPRLTGQIIDATMLGGDLVRLRQILFWFVGLCVAIGCFSYTFEYLIGSVSIRMLRDLRARLFEHLITLAPDFYESRQIGELLSRIGSDLTLVQEFLTRTVPTGIRAVVSLLGILILLFCINIKLTLVALLAIPPVALGAVIIGQFLRKHAAQQQDALAGTSAITEEVLSGLRTVQAAGQERFETHRYLKKLDSLLGIQFKNVRSQSRLGALLTFVHHFASVMVLWYGGRLIIHQELSPGQLVSFMLYTAAMGGTVAVFGKMYAGYQTVVGASTRIFELFDTRSSIQDPVNAAELLLDGGRVTFHDVSFHYPSAKGRPAIEDLQIEIQPGEMVGLVGPSGAGKSTLFSLLLRFYDPSKGSISIDGRDIRSVRLKDLRQAIGIVPQDIFLFSGTVQENISYFKPDSTLAEVRAAAVAAGADEFIRELPNGYEEMVGQRGVKLSTGQRQRIAIARAFLTNPAILLLDEATSSLDPDSEEKVKQALARLLQGRTTFVIAHRLTTARQANRILVMERGRIIGSGSHDTLYDTNDLYRRYWTLQSLKEGEKAAEKEVAVA